MLTEDEVNDRMRHWLEHKLGYKMRDHHLGTSPGYAILAEKEGRAVYVECKGSCSPKTPGKEFDRNHDTYKRVAEAVFTAVQLRFEPNQLETANETSPVCLAFPEQGHYQYYLDGIEEFFRKNGVTVYLVPDTGDPRECPTSIAD